MQDDPELIDPDPAFLIKLNALTATQEWGIRMLLCSYWEMTRRGDAPDLRQMGFPLQTK